VKLYKLYHTNLGIYPIVTKVILDNTFTTYESIYIAIREYKNKNVLLYIKNDFNNWDELNWLIPRLISEFYYVNVWTENLDDISNIHCNSLILSMNFTAFRYKNKILHDLTENDIVIFDVSIKEFKVIREMYEKKEFKFVPMLKNNNITYQQLAEAKIYSIPFLVMEEI